MTGRHPFKVCGVLLVLGSIPFLAGQGCPGIGSSGLNPAVQQESSSVAGVMISAGGGQVTVDILYDDDGAAGGNAEVSIWGGPQAVLVPANQTIMNANFVLCGPPIPVAAPTTQICMQVVTQDTWAGVAGLADTHHVSSFYFSAWDDGDPNLPGAVNNSGNVPTIVASFPGVANNGVDLNSLANDAAADAELIIRVTGIRFQNGAAVQLTQVTEVVNVLTGNSVPYVLYMRDGPTTIGEARGRFFDLAGLVWNIQDPATLIPPAPAGTVPTYSAQIPGAYFFDVANVTEYGWNFAAAVTGGTANGDATGEFEYIVKPAAVVVAGGTSATAPDALVTAEGVAAPPRIDSDGPGFIHNIVVACCFETEP